MKQLTLNQLTDHVYWLPSDATTDRPILAAITGEHTTLLVDAGNSPAHARSFLQALSQIDSAPPTFLVLTHWHWDHVFGTSAFSSPIFAHTETKRIVAEMAQLDWTDAALDRRVQAGTEIEFCRDMIKAELSDRTNLTIRVPDVAFTTRIELDLGGVTCDLVHIGGDHAADSSIIYVREDNVMVLGDCLYPDIHHGAPRYTSELLFALLEQVLSYAAHFYLLAHDPDPMSRAELEAYAALFQAVGQQVERIGRDRESVLSALQQSIKKPLDEDQIEVVDAFLAGLNKGVDNG